MKPSEKIRKIMQRKDAEEEGFKYTDFNEEMSYARTRRVESIIEYLDEEFEKLNKNESSISTSFIELHNPLINNPILIQINNDICTIDIEKLRKKTTCQINEIIIKNIGDKK